MPAALMTRDPQVSSCSGRGQRETSITPAGTPVPVVNRLNEEINKPLARPETKERLRTLGATTVGGSPAEFAEFLQKDNERWSRVVKAAGIKGV
jgi:tripartite-type tricarboxylate transporter receptor subunit TctC